MRVLKFADEHYEIVKSWWEKHQDWEPIPLHCLPIEGGIVFDGNAPIACGFLYRTDSALCMIEHIVADPDSHYLIRARALDVLMDYLIDLTDPSEVIVAWLKNERLIERYKQHGFVAGDSNMISLVRQGGGKKWQQHHLS